MRTNLNSKKFFIVPLFLFYCFWTNANECSTYIKNLRNDQNNIRHFYTHDYAMSNSLQRRCRYHIQELQKLTNEGTQFSLQPLNQAKLDKLSDFASSCLVHPNEIANENLQTFLNKLMSTIVLIIDKSNKEVRCTGIIKDNWLITARHCFWDKSAGTKIKIDNDECSTVSLKSADEFLYYIPKTLDKNGEYINLDKNNVSSPDIYKDENNHYLCKHNHWFSKDTNLKIAESDWIKIKLVDSVKNIKQSKIVKGLNLKNYNKEDLHPQFMLLGFSKALFYDQQAKYPNKNFDHYYDKSLYIDLSETMCRPLLKKGNLYNHGCQTLTAGSGSPIIAFMNNPKEITSWEHVGINTGSEGFEYLCGESDKIDILDFGLGLNLAISINHFEYDE